MTKRKRKTLLHLILLANLTKRERKRIEGWKKFLKANPIFARRILAPMIEKIKENCRGKHGKAQT